MKTLKTRCPNLTRFFGIGSAFLLALGLATAIPSRAQTFTTLASFDETDGVDPWNASLTQGRDGNLYATTTEGGTNADCYEGQYYGCGTVFKVTLAGVLTSLHSFCAPPNCADGAEALEGVVLAVDGNFYGTTFAGGNNSEGTFFKITPGGNLTTLYSFCAQNNCADGGGPVGLVQGRDGNFYGVTEDGGANGLSGTVYKITAGGKLTTLYNFCSQNQCSDGAHPVANLIQAADGNFYGVARDGGYYRTVCNDTPCGTVFKITPEGKLTTLHIFCPGKYGCPGGGAPYGPLVEAADGDFYGTTLYAGANGAGTVFKVTREGKFKALYSFCSQPSCADGSSALGGLVHATDGNLYGTTFWGGANGAGTLFRITPDGALTTLYSLCSEANCADGGNPQAGLIQATDGNLYGMALSGGTNTCWNESCGTIFKLDMGLGPFVAFVRGVGKIGQTAKILGQGFNGTSGVSFNGTPANFTVHRDTYLSATVPQGATTGFVTVTTPGGTLTSNVPFRVRP
jgi:uncharacterized repeat protein (TIGR03803 family)